MEPMTKLSRTGTALSSSKEPTLPIRYSSTSMFDLQRSMNRLQLVSLEEAGHNNVEADYMDELLTSLNDFFLHLEKLQPDDDQRSCSTTSRDDSDESDG